MKTTIWVVTLACAGALLSLKDANWLGDPTLEKLTFLAKALLVGGVLGACIGQIVKPVKNQSERLQKLFLWICAFALLGLALGHGNVPWNRTFKIISYSCIVGAVIGAIHYLFARQLTSKIETK